MFHLQSIIPITEQGAGKDIEEVRFAIDMAIASDMKIAVVVRVHFDDPLMHQTQQHGSTIQQQMYILVTRTREYNQYSILMKEGHDGCRVALWFSNEKLSDMVVSPFYQQSDYAKICDTELIQQILIATEKLMIAKTFPSLDALMKARDQFFFQ